MVIRLNWLLASREGLQANSIESNLYDCVPTEGITTL